MRQHPTKPHQMKRDLNPIAMEWHIWQICEQNMGQVPKVGSMESKHGELCTKTTQRRWWPTLGPTQASLHGICLPCNLTSRKTIKDYEMNEEEKRDTNKEDQRFADQMRMDGGLSGMDDSSVASLSQNEDGLGS